MEEETMRTLSFRSIVFSVFHFIEQFEMSDELCESELSEWDFDAELCLVWYNHTSIRIIRSKEKLFPPQVSNSVPN